MAERVIDTNATEVPEMDDLLQKLLTYLVREAKGRMEKGESFNPFVGVAVKESLILEDITGDTSDEVFRMAKHTVENTRGAQAYGFCYDGYLETEDGQKDAIMAEGGMAGQPEGYAICLMYEPGETPGTYTFVPPISYVGMAPNFMALLFNDEKPFVPPEEGEKVAEQSADAAEDSDDSQTEANAEEAQ